MKSPMKLSFHRIILVDFLHSGANLFICNFFATKVNFIHEQNSHLSHTLFVGLWRL